MTTMGGWRVHSIAAALTISFATYNTQSTIAKELPPSVSEALQMAKRQTVLGHGKIKEVGNENKVVVPSFAEEYIAHDLQPWQEGGITAEMLDEARTSVSTRCAKETDVGSQAGADGFRFQILSGELYIDSSEVGPCCGMFDWSPVPGACYGEHASVIRRDIRAQNVGFPCADDIQMYEGRAPLAILGLMELLRTHPEQVPDLDAVMIFPDIPCFEKNTSYREGTPPPLFSAYGSAATADIPFPAYTFWAQEQPYLTFHSKTNMGWGRQRAQYRSYAKPWADKKAGAVWRGNMDAGDSTRRKLCDCQGSGMDFCGAPMDGEELCQHKFLVFVPGIAWSHQLRNQMACSSIIVAAESPIYEFWSRALRPGQHYIPLPKDDPCSTLARLLGYRAGEEEDQKHQRIAEAAGAFVKEELQMPKVYGYAVRLLQEYAKLLRFRPARSRGARKISRFNLFEEFVPTGWEQLRTGFSYYQEPKPSASAGCCNFPRMIGNNPFPVADKEYPKPLKKSTDPRIRKEWSAAAQHNKAGNEEYPRKIADKWLTSGMR